MSWFLRVSSHQIPDHPVKSRIPRMFKPPCVSHVLSPVDKAALEQAWHSLQSGLLAWKTELHIAAAAAAARLRGKLSDKEREATAITLLFDQSGSMRGQKMLFAAATADVVQEFLITLGFQREVLGYTTSRWRGGRSRRRWRWHFMPSHPGRLNDLLHVVYISADDHRASSGGRAFRHMLRPDLPKENIDGEAIIWAARRLSAMPVNRRHLIVLSDGAPVDDSTIMENGNAYLGDHLRAVVDNISAAGEIEIAAIGIGYEVQRFYPVTSHVEAPDQLGAALLSLLEKVLLD